MAVRDLAQEDDGGRAWGPVDGTRARGTLSLREARDLRRGYSINRIYVAIAYLGEIVIIMASLLGAWIFAQKYGDGTQATFIMMMLAPASYAVVEMCRVPMAIAFRTQRNLLLKGVLFIGICCAAGVTVKSLSQLGEQMFHPRLIEAVKADEALKAAERDRAAFERRLADADERVKQRSSALSAIDDRARALAAEMGGIRSPACVQTSWTDRSGRTQRGARCPPEDPRGAIIRANLDRTAAERAVAQEQFEATVAERAALDRTPFDARVGEAKEVHRSAIMNSQLHSFAAMVFRKSPGDVTDGEIHRFLFVFVFFPAVFASIAATLLALGAVTRVHAPPQPVALAGQAGAYVLGPLAEHIIRQTTESLHRSAQAEVAEAAARAGGPRIKAVT